MKRWKAILFGLAASFVLYGCSEQQKVEAGNRAAEAKQRTGQALEKARVQLTDGGITLKVKTAMVSSDKLQTGDIHVDTKNRVCYLKGSVPSADQRALAERIAKDTVGKDVAVIDELQVQTVVDKSKKIKHYK